MRWSHSVLPGVSSLWCCSVLIMAGGKTKTSAFQRQTQIKEDPPRSLESLQPVILRNSNSLGFRLDSKESSVTMVQSIGSGVRFLGFESWLHHFPAVWSLANDSFSILWFLICQIWIMTELVCTSYLLPCNKLP